MSRPALTDPRDIAILTSRVARYNEQPDARVGDYVRFTDGVLRRISHHWGDRVQTSNGGSYYLDDGYISMSGGLFVGVPVETLTLTNERLPGSVWFFHHDYATAGGGVSAYMEFRVFTCSQTAPTS